MVPHQLSAAEQRAAAASAALARFEAQAQHVSLVQHMFDEPTCTLRTLSLCMIAMLFVPHTHIQHTIIRAHTRASTRAASA